MPRKKRREEKAPRVPDSRGPRRQEEPVPPPERDPETIGEPPEKEPEASALEDPETAAPARGQPDHESDEVF